MTASVTFQEIRKADARQQSAGTSAAPIVLIPKRTLTEQNGTPAVWVVSGGKSARRSVVLGRERLDQVEVQSGVVAGEALVLNPPPGLTDRGVVRLKGK
jgi:HlyD family secretion protein